MRRSENQRQVLFHFWHRLILLYLFWVVIWSPIILIQKQYHHYGFEGILLFVRDFFFGSTFDASCFLGALIVGVPIVYGLSKILKEWMVWIIPFGVFLYLHYYQQLPIDWQKPFIWYNGTIENPNLAFPNGLLWIAIGFHLSNNRIVERFSKIHNKIFWIAFAACFVIIDIGIIHIIPLIACVILLFMASYTWRLPNLKLVVCKRLRTYSILFYVIHDCFKKIPKQLFGWHNGPLLYVVTILFCFIASEFIIRMKDVRGFYWLKYAY